MTTGAVPIQPADGFPQSFVMSMGDNLYRLTFSVSFLTLEPFRPLPTDPDPVPIVPGPVPRAPSGLDGEFLLPVPEPTRDHGLRYPLPQDDLYLVLKVEREDLPDDRRVLGITRAVPGLPTRFGDLVVTFSTIEVARGNLHGPGEFGSRVVAEVSQDG